MEVKKCQAYIERDAKVIAKASHLPYFPLVIAKGDGALLEDVDGNGFIDFLSSGASLNLGSSHPAVTAAIEAQLKCCTQYTAAYSYNAPMIEYAEKLVSVYPGGESAKVCFGNCGSDANDAAIKFSRAFTGRRSIITFINGYHGNTFGAMTLSTVTTRMRSKMGPFLPDVHSFPFSTCYRCPYGKEEKNCDVECLNPMLTAFGAYLPAEEVAAVIIEPIQGDSGVVLASPKYLKKLHKICQENGILFIAEEVQQAFGRTGTWFSIEHYGIVPDGIVLGKALGGGLTLGAFMAKTAIIDSLPAPAHTFTLGGNALACCAGMAAFDVLSEKGFFEAVLEKGVLLQEIFKALQAKYHMIGEIRSAGLSMGVEIVKDPQTKERDTDSATRICYRCYENGLIMITLSGNVLRIQPPLVITKAQIHQAAHILNQAFDDLVNHRIPDSVLAQCKGW